MWLNFIIEQVNKHTNLRPLKTWGNIQISGISSDSRSIKPGDLFVCMPSRNTNTHELIPEVKAKGAVGVLTHSEEGNRLAEENNLPYAQIETNNYSFLEYISEFCKVFFDDPTSKMRVVGITGTNGKSTTAWILRDILEAMGEASAYVGTLGVKTNRYHDKLLNTTPFPVELWKVLNRLALEGVENVFIEASSEGLAQKRMSGINFDAAVFTNLTQDHLNFHGSMEAYTQAKKILFTDFAQSTNKEFKAILCEDDTTGQLWAKEFKKSKKFEVSTYGISQGDMTAKVDHLDFYSLSMKLKSGKSTQAILANLGGMFNVMNCLSSIACLTALGYRLTSIAEAIKKATAVPGRFESISNSHGINVIVDYAHAPDALKSLLVTAKQLTKGRVITVFGCGGDRDQLKRPLMANVVGTLSDISIITSDNPRTEDTCAIIKDVQQGMPNGSEYRTICDRIEAIHEAVKIARADDVVVIAGKGHEDYQIIGRQKHPMDDRKIARDALAQRDGTNIN